MKSNINFQPGRDNVKLNTAEKAAAVITALFILGLIAVWLSSARGGGVTVSARTPASESAELAGADASESDELKPGERVNINTASRTELEKLPGIGEKLAGSIIEYRTANGPFKTADGLMNVPGIGQAKFDAVKGSITT